MIMHEMQDRFNRTIDYMRVSITDRCNMRCIYCMPEGVDKVEHGDILRFDETLRICEAAAAIGLKKVKITGGEPLVRKDAIQLMRGIKAIAGIEQVTLTTNGLLLERYFDELQRVGLSGINISLDTLDKDLYHQITGVDALEQVLQSAITWVQKTTVPVKINAVPLAMTAEQLLNLVELAQNHPIHIRFIEMMPIGYGKQYQYISEDAIKQQIVAKYGALQPVDATLGNGPGRYYHISGFKGKVGFISAMSHQFCHQCNRVRLTSQGFLKTCLQYDQGQDLRELVRSNITKEQLSAVIYDTIKNKPLAHQFSDYQSLEQSEERTMNQVGG